MNINMTSTEQKNIDVLSVTPYNDDKIYLFLQFYLDKDPQRLTETVTSLNNNIKLNIFDKIYLLNERIYTEQELQLDSKSLEKIIQVNIGKRLTYSDVLNYVINTNINGYIVIANSDIFFDNTINNIRYTTLSEQKSLYALTRLEYSDINFNKLDTCNLSKGGGSCQDTWILHSNFIPNKKEITLCDFELGRVGCDNKITYLFNSFGFIIYNEPYIIKTYHYHTEKSRNVHEREKFRIPRPYLFIIPNIRP